MGSDKARDPEADDYELPQHTVTLPGYWIGRYPVTVARFKAFVTEGVYKPAEAYSLKGRDDHPVVDVSWDDARAYCEWWPPFPLDFDPLDSGALIRSPCSRCQDLTADFCANWAAGLPPPPRMRATTGGEHPGRWHRLRSVRGDV